MTTRLRPYPSPVPVVFVGKAGQIALDQLRTVDVSRLARRLGEVDRATAEMILAVLAAMFAP